MLTRITKLSFAGTLCVALAAGCHSPPSSTSEPSAAATTPKTDVKAVPEVTVAEVASYTKGKSATVLDANDSDTRKEYGVIPGAVLLAGKNYELSQLPTAKTDKLVFYCGGTRCRASDAAAARAASAGYTDVSVMRAGIRGWKDAGMPTAAPQS